MSVKKLQGKLTIAYIHGGTGMVSILLTDAVSRCDLVEITVEKAVFADALFARADVPCAYEYHADCPAGKRREVKTVPVFVPSHAYKDRATVVRQAVAEHERDGWEGRDSDAVNMHRRSATKERTELGDWYDVVFIRFVE